MCFPSFVFSDQPVVYLASRLLHRANALKSPSQSPIEGSSSGEWVQTELLPELPKTLPVRFDELLMSIFPIFVYTLTKYGSRVTIVTFVNCQILKLMFDLALKKVANSKLAFGMLVGISGRHASLSTKLVSVGSVQ